MQSGSQSWMMIDDVLLQLLRYTQPYSIILKYSTAHTAQAHHHPTQFGKDVLQGSLEEWEECVV